MSLHILIWMFFSGLGVHWKWCSKIRSETLLTNCVAMTTLCVSDTVLRRFSNTLRFCWVLLSALLDSLTAWLNGLCQEHVDISTVLRIERCMLTHQAKQVHSQDYNKDGGAECVMINSDVSVQGHAPSREAIHVYYQEQMMRGSRESGLDYSTHEAELQASAETGRKEEEEEEGVSPSTDTEEEEDEAGGQTAEKPELGADGPDEPGPVSGGSGEELGGPSADPECFVANTSQRRRPKLSRMDRVRSSSSSSSSEGQSHRSASSNSGEESNQRLPVDPHTFTSASSPTSPSSVLLPPSYSLALGLDQHQEAESNFRRQTPLERRDFLSDSASTSCPLASHTQELTASELLRNR